MNDASHQTRTSENTPSNSSSWKVLVVTSIAAILTGFAAWYFVLAEDWGSTLLDRLRGHETFFGYQIDGPLRVIIPAGFMAVMMMLIVVVQRKWFPGTEGTGIPQAIAALKIGSCKERSLMLSLRIAFGKTILLTGALISGITVGREGPSVHVGACLMQLSCRFVRVPPWLMERGLILAGSAAGIAAAFNTPIAGVIFCFEEVGRTFDKKSVACIIRTVALACAVGVFFMGDYHFYTEVNRQVALPLGFLSGGDWAGFVSEIRQWLAVPIIGIVGGFLGGWFGRFVVTVSAFTGPRLVKHPWITGGVLGLTLALVAVCSFGESYGGGYAQAKQMLVNAHATGAPETVWYYPLAKASASFVSLVSAIPGGLFDPSLATGAGLGQVTYPLFDQYIAPGIGLPQVMMLFMAAYFAGVVQSPITVFAIMAEMTGAYGMILPLMFAAMIGAMVASRICEPSIYEALARQFLVAKKLQDLAPSEEDD